MYYVISENEVKKITKRNQVPEGSRFLGYLTMDEWEETVKELSIPGQMRQQITNIDTSFRSSMQIHGEYLFGTVTIIDVQEWNKNRCQIGLVFHKDYFLIISIVDEQKDVRKKFLKCLETYNTMPSLEKMLYVFFDSMLLGTSEVLEKMEKQMVMMEHELVLNRIDVEFNKELFILKKQLSVLKNYYEEWIDISHVLQEDELEIFEKNQLHYFRIFAQKANRYCESVKETREGVVHLREALDASLEYNLNQIMKFFTVVTTVFLPLTLIVGWYGMNFKYMPELNWEYGYGFVAGLCVIVMICCFVYFRKKHFL